MTLGFVAAVLCLATILAGASMGLSGSLALSQPSPSGSPSGSPPGGGAPSIVLLNPSPAYDPGAEFVEDPLFSAGPPPSIITFPKVSDKFDGRDSAYHIVATVGNAPRAALVEAYYQPASPAGNELTIGQMAPVPGAPDTYEFFWDVPSSLNASRGFVVARLYEESATGFEQIGEHSVEVRIMIAGIVYTGGNAASAAETVEITWPSQNGPLGFYKGAAAGSAWKTVVDGTASVFTPQGRPQDPNEHGSNGTNRIRLFYSTTASGLEPEFTFCGDGTLDGVDDRGFQTWQIECTLQGTHRPSQVTAFGAVAMEDHDDSGEGEPVYSQEAADVHVLQPYLQRVEDMQLDLSSNATTDQPVRRHRSMGTSSTSCLSYRVDVKDPLDRPVEGANVDIHIRGPGDQVQFGTDANSSSTNNSSSSGKQRPQKDHSTEAGRNCDANNNTAEQGDHNVPGADDIKHIESTLGSGESGGASAGRGGWVFHLWSQNAGDTAITAWIDDEPVANDSEKRAADDDILEPAEKSDTNFAQWLTAAPAVTIDPIGATAATGGCQRFIVRVRGGTRAVRGANVDVHAVGPTNDLDFCDPGDASARRAPDAGTGHTAEDEGEMVHAGQPPVAQHTEGVTNDQGNFVIGVTSPVPGDTSLTAWYDAGEDGFDNDNQDSGEANGSATTNWVESTADAAISFLNPSPYGSSGEGTQVARTQDVDNAYHIVTRVSSIAPVAGVEIFYRSGSDPLVKIADASQIGQTDVYEAFWPVNVADGSYTLVARIRDTAVTAEQSVTVNNSPTMTNPQDVPFETAEITAPLNGARAAFTGRKVQIKGVTSAGTEGIDLFYTKASSLSTPGSSAWISCGFAGVGSGSAPKEFTGDCQLQGSDQPGMVTGLAVLPYDCVQSGCNAAPGARPDGGRNPGARDSGDAHRVFGAEANPLLTMEPAETAADIGPCQKFVVSLTDQTGQPIPGQNLDVHLTGPGNSGNFCAPEDGTGTPRQAPDLGGHTADGDETDEAYHDEGGARIHHTEGETTGNGRLIFGIESETAGDAQLTVWLDSNDDDVFDQGETNDISVMHWEAESACDITGTNGPDVLEGSDGPERICGFGGDDTIRGGGGGDTLLGGAGRDELRGNAGDDGGFGGADRDEVFGGGGRDRLSGGGGPDFVNGHRSDDRLRGNRGNDRLNGGPGRDDCSGGGGRDRLRKCETGTRSFAARTRPI